MPLITQSDWVQELVTVELLDYQRDFLDADEDCNRRQMAGARQTGKTVAGAGLALDWAYNQHLRVGVLSPAWGQSDSFYFKLKSIWEDDVEDGVTWATNEEVLFDPGVIRFVPVSHYAQWRGGDYDAIIVENADMVASSRLMALIEEFDDSDTPVALLGTPDPRAWVFTGIMYDPSWHTVAVGMFDNPLVNREMGEVYSQSMDPEIAKFHVYADPAMDADELATYWEEIEEDDDD